MNSPHDERAATAFEQQAREAFADSVAQLDAATLSRLNQSRQRALDAAGRRASSRQRWLMWAPAGAVAAAALIAVLVLRAPSTPEAVAPVAVNATPDAALDPLVVLAAGDDLEMAAEADLEFYAWVDLETTGDGVT